MENIVSLYKELLNLKIEILKLSETITKLVKLTKYEDAAIIDKSRKVLFNRVQELQLEINALPKPTNNEDDFLQSMSFFESTFNDIDYTTIPKIKNYIIELESIKIKSDDIKKQIEIFRFLID